MKQLQIHLMQDEAYCKNQSCSMQTMRTSIHILYSFIFPIPSTSLEWQIHVTQRSKDKLRGSQTTNIHQPVMNQSSKSKFGRLVHHFYTVCSLGWCCNLFQNPESPPLCSTKATVWSKACRAVADGAESKRWKNLPVSSVCRVQSAESPTVPKYLHQWDCMIILYYCKIISSNKIHTHNIWKIVSHTHTYIYK